MLKENLDNYLVNNFKFSESLSSILDVVNEIWANKYRPKIEKSKCALQLLKINRFDSDDNIWSDHMISGYDTDTNVAGRM